MHSQFGRCDYFLITDTATGAMQAIANTHAQDAAGAGTACAQILFNEDVAAVISRQYGPNAYEVLSQGEIQMYVCPRGITADEALRKFKEGSLQKMQLARF